MSNVRRFFAFLLAPFGVVAMFFLYGLVKGRSPGEMDLWNALFTSIVMLVVGWTAELVLALPLLYVAMRSGWTTWSAHLTIGAAVGAIVSLLLLRVWRQDGQLEPLFIAGCTIGGVASAALHRLIAPDLRGEADDARSAPAEEISTTSNTR